MNSSQWPNSRLLFWIKTIPSAASAIAILVSSLVLAGWILDIPTLKSVLPNLVTMKANTAISFLLSGVALGLLQRQQVNQSKRRIVQWCALIVVTIGGLTLSEYLFNWNLDIDQLVFREMPGAVGTSHPGRMAPNTALNFILIGSALLLVSRKNHRCYWLVQVLTLIAGLIAWQPLLGYAYNFEPLYGIASFTHMALHTVLVFIVLCFGILFARPGRGVMRVITSNTTGGFLARRLLVAAIAFPSLLGYVILQGERAQLYNSPFALSLLVMASIVVFAISIWQNAETLARSDTQRKQAEAALDTLNQDLQRRVSELQTLFEVIPISIAIADDRECQHIRVNSTFAQLLEIPSDANASCTPPDGTAPLPFKVFHQGRELPGDEQPLQYAATHGTEVRDFELDILQNNGVLINLFGHAAPLLDEQGNPRGAVGAFLDITERKHIQEALTDTNQTLQALIRACPLAITVFNLDDGQVKLWNPAAEEIFGWSEQEVLGHFLPSVPDDKREEFLNNLHFIREGKTLTGVETRRQKKGGLPIDINLWAAPLRDAKGNVSCMSIVADISERQAALRERKQAEAALRESEERFRKLTEKVRVIPWQADPITGQFTYVGPQTVEILGYPLEDWYSENFWPEHIHPDDRDWAIAYCQDNSVILNNYEFEYRMLAADGRIVWLYDIVNVVHKNGQPSLLRGFMIDITERKRAEEEREQSLAREQIARAEAEQARSTAESANRMKDEFLATLSHELRTPLNAMLGWTHMLRTRTLDETTTIRALESIERNTKSLATLIEDVLDVSRIIRGKLHLTINPIELVPVIDAAIDTIRPAAQAKDIQIKSVLDPSVGLVLGDANRLQQIIWNLLSNAVKFTPKGGQVEVQLSVVNNNEQQTTDNYVQIQVSDTGKGITPEFLPYVFDRFRQEDNSTTRTYGGLGLGLAIVRHLVELHGGTVHADSLGEGLGATFSVYLPRL